VNAMDVNEISSLTIEKLLADVWRRRGLVALCGIIGAILVAVAITLAPKFETRLEVQPPGWEALGALEDSGLVDFDREKLFNLFLWHCQARSTTLQAKDVVQAKRLKENTTNGNLSVSVQILGGMPRSKDPLAPQVLVATGSSANDVTAFLTEITNIARQRVLDDAHAKLRAAIVLRQNQISKELESLNTGGILQKKEAQRHEDRASSLQGAMHTQIPLAFMDSEELLAERLRFENLDFPIALDIAAQVDPNLMQEPRAWYTLGHSVIGLIVGLLLGCWLAITLKSASERS